MNLVAIVGRLTQSPEVRYTSSDNPKAVCNFSLAVERKFKDANGNAITDFIDCCVFGKTAEFLGKWFDKGVRVGVTGELQTSVYEKDGQKHKSVQVIVNTVEFADGKREVNANTNTNTFAQDTSDDFIPLDADDKLPFN